MLGGSKAPPFACSSQSPSITLFLMEKKKKDWSHTSDHAVALTKWLLALCSTLSSPSLDPSSYQPPLKMAGTYWHLSSLSPFLCSDLETEMEEWCCSHNCCDTVRLPPLPKNTPQQNVSRLHWQLEEGAGGGTLRTSTSIKIGLGCLSMVLFYFPLT